MNRKTIVLSAGMLALALLVAGLMPAGAFAQQERRSQFNPYFPSQPESRVFQQPSQQGRPDAAAAQQQAPPVKPPEETSSETRHSIMLGGKPLPYTAVAGTMLLKTEEGVSVFTLGADVIGLAGYFRELVSSFHRVAPGAAPDPTRI